LALSPTFTFAWDLSVLLDERSSDKQAALEKQTLDHIRLLQARVVAGDRTPDHLSSAPPQRLPQLPHRLQVLIHRARV